MVDRDCFGILFRLFSAMLDVNRSRPGARLLVGLRFGSFGPLVAAIPLIEKGHTEQQSISDCDVLCGV